MRKLVSDEEFQQERESLHRRRTDLERVLASPAAGNPEQEARKAQVAAQIDLIHGAPLVIEEGTPVQLRAMLQQLQLKITLRGRRLDISALEPLSHLVKAGSVSNWCLSTTAVGLTLAINLDFE